MQKLEKRIRKLAAADEQDNRLDQEIARKRTELSEVEKQRDQATQNLARAKTDEQYGAARQISDLLNARLFLEFRPVKVKKRTLNKITGGVATFGEAQLPIKIYEGPTARRKVKVPAASCVVGSGDGQPPSPPESSGFSGREGKSLGNVSRGDWI